VMATKQQVIDAHRADPALTAPALAAALGTTSAYVRATAQRCSLALPKAPPHRRGGRRTRSHPSGS
jgi:hypothetical protein